MPKSREAMARVRSSSVTAFSRTRLRTRAISAVSSSGLVRKSSAPASRPLSAVAGLVEGGHHDDRKMRGQRRVLEPPADLEAVHAGHHDVEQDDVAQALLAERQRVGPVHRGDDVEILGR